MGTLRWASLQDITRELGTQVTGGQAFCQGCPSEETLPTRKGRCLVAIALPLGPLVVSLTYLYDPDLTPNTCNPPPLQLSLVSASPPPCKVQSEAESTPCEVQSLGKGSLKHVAFLFRALVLQPAEARLTTRILCPWRAYSWRLTALTTGKTLTLSRGCQTDCRSSVSQCLSYLAA